MDYEIGGTYPLWRWTGQDAEQVACEYVGAAPSSGVDVFLLGNGVERLGLNVWEEREGAIGFGLEFAEAVSMSTAHTAKKIRTLGTLREGDEWKGGV